MIASLFHAWERRLASVDTNRVVRPFEWGLPWVGLDPSSPDPGRALSEWSRRTMADTDAYYGESPAADYERRGDLLLFSSARVTPHPENDLVRVRVFPAADRPGRPRRAVVVLPQWNADAGGHVGLCQVFARFGLTALRLSLPYHDERRPPELTRADYIVSANVGRTADANRQAVLDARRAVDWLVREGYERIGIIGTSLGSCLSMLTMAHDSRIKAGAFNHVSPYFADVVWRGLSTAHVRAGLDGHVTLDELREWWLPISPWPFIDRVRGRPVLLVYARYDLTFPVDLSRNFLAEFDRRGVPHKVGVLPCGHYTTGKAPFKYLDGYYLTKFFLDNL
ncbi:MAG: alpha/beta hydrolase family protein [Vicinamibacterales bacterium]